MTTISTATASAGFVPDFLTGMTRRVTSYVSMSRARRQLEALDDRLLADIGLNRSEIDTVIHGR